MMNGMQTPKYRTGEIIMPGDHVLLGDWTGVVEFIMTKDSPDWEGYWSTLGEGVMLQGPEFGSCYAKLSDEDLEFVGRKIKE